VHRTPYIESQKWLPWQHPLELRNRLYLHRIAWPRKPTPRIKQRVASYHTTKVIAHRTPKPVIANCVPKKGCHGNVPQHLWTPIQHMIPTAHPSPQPKRHPYQFSCLCTDDRRVSLYFTMGRPFSPNICPFPWGIWTPSNTWFHGSTQVLNPNGSSISAAVLQGSLVWQTDRQTDRPRYSVGKNRPHLRT